MRLHSTRKEIRAVESSIRHWKKDIQAKLLKGLKIDPDDMEWADTGHEVKYTDEYCSLCLLAFKKTHESGEQCQACLYFKKNMASDAIIAKRGTGAGLSSVPIYRHATG